MNSRNAISFWFAVLVIMLAVPSLAQQAPPGGGQGGGQRGGGRGQAAPPTTLQVLPKDMTRQQVVQIMQTFTMGLGVTCDYCHVPQAGAQPGPNGQIPVDAASDDKQTKQTARVMMKMVTDINTKLGSELGKPAANVVQVQCITCHRGSATPKTQ